MNRELFSQIADCPEGFPARCPRRCWHLCYPRIGRSVFQRYLLQTSPT